METQRVDLLLSLTGKVKAGAIGRFCEIGKKGWAGTEPVNMAPIFTRQPYFINAS